MEKNLPGSPVRGSRGLDMRGTEAAVVGWCLEAGRRTGAHPSRRQDHRDCESVDFDQASRSA